MMATNGNVAEFEGWLSKKLTELDIDSDVYGSYITGILEEEDEVENKKEALEGILGSLLEDPEELCKQVLEKWKPFDKEDETKIETKSTIEDILAAHSAKVSTVQPTEKSTNNSNSGDSAIKRAVLEKYAEVYEEIAEDEQEEKKPSSKTPGSAPTLGLFKNVNVKAVTDAEKQKREKQKEDNQKKKEKDKLDREKQKQKKEERKEKEKKRTQKQERKAR